MTEEAPANPFEAGEVTIVYGGEQGEGWVPASKRQLWDYGVKTGQIIVPGLDDGGEWTVPIDPGDSVLVTWVPPELRDKLVELPPEPQPRRFGFKEGE